MILRNTLAALTAVALFSGSALAQTPTPAPDAAPAPAPAAKDPSPTPEEIAAARAVAVAVIDRLAIGDIFEDYTTDKIPTIRHKASRMTCWVEPDATSDDIHVYEGLPRGEDVSCNDNILEITRTLYATRYPERPTAEAIVAGSIQAMQARFSKMKPYTGAGMSMTRDGIQLPKVTTARFTAVIGGKKVFTRTSAVVVGDWVYAQRITAPEKDAMMAELMAEMQLMELLVAVTGQEV